MNIKEMIICLLVIGVSVSIAYAYPNPVTGQRVYDYANILTSDQQAHLQSLCLDMERNTTSQVALVIVPSLDGQSVEDYAYGLFNQWGIGQKDKNNGLLILVSIGDRKYRFETGYGTEPIITDGEAGRIGRQCFVDNFRAQKYYEGMDCALQQVASYLNGTGLPDTLPGNMTPDLSPGGMVTSFLPIAFILGIIVLAIGSFSSGSSRDYEESYSSSSSDYEDWSYPRVCPYCAAALTLAMLRKDRHCPKCGKLVPRKKRTKDHHHNNFIFIPIGFGSDSDSGGSSGGGSSGGGDSDSGGGSFGGGSGGGGGASGGW